MTNPATIIRGPWAIAMYTFREGMRKKLLIGFLVLSLLFIFGANFITAFLFESGSGSGPRSDVDTKLVKDIYVTVISMFGVLITIFISASVVPTEVDNKVIYTVLSKPLRRWQYILGKFIGAQMIIIVNLLLMGLLAFVALYFKERTWSAMLLLSLVLTYFEFLIVSAFTFAISCTASSAVLPTIAGLFIYITGLMTPYLKDVYERAGQTTQFLDEMIGTVAMWLYRILPNLSFFSLRNEIINNQPFETVQAGRVADLVMYSLLFSVTGFVLSYWLFRRREL